MATKYTMKAHDLEPSFEVQLLDGTIPVDLTSVVSALFLMKTRKGIKVAGLMTIPDQSILMNVGIVRYDWVSGDTDTPGTFTAEVQVTWPGGRPQTFPASRYVTIQIDKDLGPIVVFAGSVTLNGGGDLSATGLSDQVMAQ